MIDEQLDRWLANRFEPEPSKPTENVYVQPGHPKPSPKGWWQLTDVWGEQEYQWIAMPLSTTWHGAGRIFDAMEYRGFDWEVSGCVASGQSTANFWLCEEPNDGLYSASDPDPCTAVAMAAKKALEAG